jgi:hypothetical protein
MCSVACCPSVRTRRPPPSSLTAGRRTSSFRAVQSLMLCSQMVWQRNRPRSASTLTIRPSRSSLIRSPVGARIVFQNQPFARIAAVQPSIGEKTSSCGQNRASPIMAEVRRTQPGWIRYGLQAWIDDLEGLRRYESLRFKSSASPRIPSGPSEVVGSPPPVVFGRAEMEEHHEGLGA